MPLWCGLWKMIRAGSVPLTVHRAGGFYQPDLLKLNMGEVAAHRQMGGNSGIDLAAAFAFAKEGARVVFTGRDQSTLDKAAAQLGVTGRVPQDSRDKYEVGPSSEPVHREVAIKKVAHQWENLIALVLEGEMSAGWLSPNSFVNDVPARSVDCGARQPDN
jgi:hypothetical protein